PRPHARVGVRCRPVWKRRRGRYLSRSCGARWSLGFRSSEKYLADTLLHFARRRGSRRRVVPARLWGWVLWVGSLRRWRGASARGRRRASSRRRRGIGASVVGGSPVHRTWAVRAASLRRSEATGARQNTHPRHPPPTPTPDTHPLYPALLPAHRLAR